MPWQTPSNPFAQEAHVVNVSLVEQTLRRDMQSDEPAPDDSTMLFQSPSPEILKPKPKTKAEQPPKSKLPDHTSCSPSVMIDAGNGDSIISIPGF